MCRIYITCRKGPGNIASSRPCPASVQPEAFVGNDLEEATAAESIGVRLPLDLQDIQGKEDNLSDANDTEKVSLCLSRLHWGITTFQTWRA